MEICLSEIERCRNFPPFFIGFLGERYGWVPKAGERAAYWPKAQDSPYAKHIQQAVHDGISVTELEMRLAVLERGRRRSSRGKCCSACAINHSSMNCIRRRGIDFSPLLVGDLTAARSASCWR